MFKYNSRIAVGISGGKDSISLLHVLKEIEQKWTQSELIAVSIDEGIKGYRDEALRLAQNAAKKLGIEYISLSFKELFGISMDQIASRDREITTCSYCGVLRRRALDQAAKRVGADKLATGHTLDDMAQSVLLNILRGDLNRLANFDPGGENLHGFVKRVKPFCEVPERESTFYAYLKGIQFQSLPCPYAEEAMRTDIRHFLNRMETKRPSTLFTIFRTGLKYASEKRVIEKKGVCKVCGAPTTLEVCRVCQLIEDIS